jgi:hypothetical protein
VELWDRPALATQMTPFGNAARWGAIPRITVGPVFPALDPRVEVTPWSDAAGHFRAYPNAGLTVSVKVRNDGVGLWTHPRVELFAPDNWQVSPAVAEVVSPTLAGPSVEAPSISSGTRGVLPPTVTGTATFTVRIPDTARGGLPYPLIAFLKFNARGETLTVQNSVDISVEQPITQRYAMSEDGSKFVIRLINRFAPAALGAPTVEVGAPANAGWKMTPPKPVNVAADVDATALVTPGAAGDAAVRIPVAVTLNGLRMDQTPMIYAAARFAGASPREDGIAPVEDAASSVSITAGGACFPPGGEHALAFDVDPAFPVSDPRQFVSPTWVTVRLNNRGATRGRLEYDAWGSDAPTVAADTPLESGSGPLTLSFLLPDARFEGKLPGGTDLRLVLAGDACVESISVAKWNPLKVK